MKPLDRVRIFTPQGESGELSGAESGDYLFRYGLDAIPASQISLTMPVRDAHLKNFGLLYRDPLGAGLRHRQHHGLSAR